MLPAQWGAKAVQAYDDWHADRIVAEGNQGGEMVRHTIQTVRANAPVTIVHAHRGKQARAEPVAALYEQRKVDHVGSFPELEDQMVTWEPLSGMASPDRLDALVWALTELAIGGGPSVHGADVSRLIEARPA
jgi:phage terminase large subunit-like protein